LKLISLILSFSHFIILFFASKFFYFTEKKKMHLLIAALIVFLMNIPFGYWREHVPRLSARWFLAIHIPIPAVVAVRFIEHLGFQLYTYPAMVAAFFSGQYFGGWLYKHYAGRYLLSGNFFKDMLRMAGHSDKLHKKPILILKAGSTYPKVVWEHGDFEDWIRRKLLRDEPLEVLEVFDMEKEMPDPGDYAGFIITGSHDDVTDHSPWVERLAGYVMYLLERRLPVLGICFGHQLLAYAAGGAVGDHPQGQELGTVTVSLTPEAKKDPLFRGLPKSFPAHVNHAQTVTRLPEGATQLAFNDFEKTHAFRTGESAWGVQFHPEYTGDIMRAQIREQYEAVKKSGRDPEKLLAEVSDKDHGRKVLRNFVRYCRTLER